MPARTREFTNVTITDLSHEGRGIAHIDGKTTFVMGALTGEVVDARIINQNSKFQSAIATAIHQASPQRITPKCPHFGVCGGCSLQHMGPEVQLQHKQEAVLQQLQHTTGITPRHILPPLQAEAWGYRRKARLGVKYVLKKDKLLVGFREHQGLFLADCEHCDVLHPSVGEKLTLWAQMLQGLEAYQHIPQLEIFVGNEATAIVLRHLKPLSDPDLALLSEFAAQHAYWLYLQPKGPGSIHRVYPQPEREGELDALSYDLPDFGLKLAFVPGDFIQVHATINQRMIAQAMDVLDLNAKDKVLDLFCGLGNFSLPMATRAASVCGIEGDAAMVARAGANAARNDIENAYFLEANCFEIKGDEPWLQASYDKILLDPPRSGAQELIPHLPKTGASHIVYVSCHPATFIRDAKLLAEQGYQLQSLGVMDMFPHTQHIECMGLFLKMPRS